MATFITNQCKMQLKYNYELFNETLVTNISTLF
jgi:hypothetical protein